MDLSPGTRTSPLRAPAGAARQGSAAAEEWPCDGFAVVRVI